MYLVVVAFVLQTFQSVSIRRLVAMTENVRISIEYRSVPDGAIMSYQFLSWNHVSAVAIGQLMYPYTLDEVEEIFIDGTRVRHRDFDSRRSFVSQLAWTPRNYDIHIYLDVYLADERNDEEDDTSNWSTFHQDRPRDPMTVHIPPSRICMEIREIRWQWIPWTDVSVMPITRLIEPYTLDEVEKIVIDGTRVRHLDFDGSRSLVSQLPWIPRRVHIYMADERCRRR